MHKNNFYIFFGLWIALLPFTGIPGVWRNGLISASGLFIVLVVLAPSILKKLNKSKTKRKSKSSLDSGFENVDQGGAFENLSQTGLSQTSTQDTNNENL